jgi:hypothetical protein
VQGSIIGVLVCAAILITAYYLRGSAITALMASLAFGSTALVTLGSLGGSSPLIYTLFAALLLMQVAFRKQLWTDLGLVFGQVQAAWIVSVLALYAMISALIYPRLFAGQTSAFVPSRTRGGVFEVPLEPVSGNTTQAGYLVIGCLTFLAVCVLLVRRRRLDDVRRGFFLWCSLHTGMGLLDFVGKMAGLGDVLAPIRTANYAMLTEVEQAGFVRIAGAYSEASAFGGVSLACLAFTYTYWRGTKSRFALAIAITLLVLVLLSTSSTAYVGLSIVSLPVAFSILRSLLRGRLAIEEILLVAVFVAGAVVTMAIILSNTHFFDSFVHLIDTAVISKATSGSGQERAYWNYKSIQSFFDTNGLGIGIGSSRASSWPVAVLSQLGAAGAVIFVVLITMLIRSGDRTSADPEGSALVASVRACGLAGLVSGSIGSGTADPGMVFFISLAIISVSRRAQLRQNNGYQPITLPRMG